MKLFSGKCPFRFTSSVYNPQMKEDNEARLQNALFGKKGVKFPNPNAYKAKVLRILDDEDLNGDQKMLQVLQHFATLANVFSPFEDMLRQTLIGIYFTEFREKIEETTDILVDKTDYFNNYTFRHNIEYVFFGGFWSSLKLRRYNKRRLLNVPEFTEFVTQLYKTWGLGVEKVDKAFLFRAASIMSDSIASLPEILSILKPFLDDDEQKEAFYKSILMMATLNRLALMYEKETKSVGAFVSADLAAILDKMQDENIQNFLRDEDLFDYLQDYPLDWTQRNDEQYLIDYMQELLDFIALNQ